ncbi:MAG: phosphatidylinositol-specific phospholipase C/glycerophosphodiester phosphodiesterase family protein [Candidatus Ventricola sp.]
MKKRQIVVLCLAVLLAAGALLLVARKAYSLYADLGRKVDYTNDIFYALNDNVQKLHWKMDSALGIYEFDYSWAEQTPPLIAHAFGEIDGNTYTNSLEAFQHSYAQGQRVFEVDLTFPDDSYTLIACHDREFWCDESGAPLNVAYTYENFMASTLCGQYTPLDYRDVIDLMAEYPDIYIVTDTKYTDQASVLLQFAQLVKYAQTRDESVLDRLIPQIYRENMLGWVMSVYPFRSVIYTVYQTDISSQEILEFCQHSGIRLVTAPAELIAPHKLAQWSGAGLIVATHTINDPEQARQLYDQGVDILYTDSLTPGDIAP